MITEVYVSQDGQLIVDGRPIPLYPLNAQGLAPNKCNNTIPMDEIQVNDHGCVMINGICATVLCYQIIVPDRVMLVEFADGTKEKMVRNLADEFNIDTGIRIAIAKHVGRKIYNQEGIEYLATRLSYLKCIDKMIHKVHVEYRRRQAEAAKNPKSTAKKRKKSAVPAKKEHRLNITRSARKPQ